MTKGNVMYNRLLPIKFLYVALKMLRADPCFLEKKNPRKKLVALQSSLIYFGTHFEALQMHEGEWEGDGY